jgi:rhodanese-related sulfurtransferase
MMAAGELDAGAVFVDVREHEEWQHGHIDGSVPAPRGPAGILRRPHQPPPQASPGPRPPGRRRMRLRRTRVARRPDLKTMGDQDVAILDGGLEGWTGTGLPVGEHEYVGI